MILLTFYYVYCVWFQNALPAYLVAQDEMESYAIEGSPFHHSMSSSLSDLTIDSSQGMKARLISKDQWVPIN